MRDFLFKPFTVLDDFYDMKEISRSSGGAVYSVYVKSNNTQKRRLNDRRYILKERKVSELGRDQDIMNEVNLLRQVDHGNVIKCEGIPPISSSLSLITVTFLIILTNCHHCLYYYHYQHQC